MENNSESKRERLSFKEIQNIEKELLKKMHIFCEKHGLKYSITYGTLIGAIRHKGFIPWDDDIDILMPRPDYNRFMELAEKEAVAENVQVLHYTKDPNYHYTFARIIDDTTDVDGDYLRDPLALTGLWIDIFPVDGCPDKPDKWTDMWKKFYYKLEKADLYHSRKVKWLWAVKNVLLFFFPNKNNSHMKKIDKLAQKYPYGSCEYCADMIEIRPVRFKAEEFDRLELIPFEDILVYALPGRDAYLRQYYGDYMQLPPEDQRKPHGYKAYRIK